MTTLLNGARIIADSSHHSVEAGMSDVATGQVTGIEQYQQAAVHPNAAIRMLEKVDALRDADDARQQRVVLRTKVVPLMDAGMSPLGASYGM